MRRALILTIGTGQGPDSDITQPIRKTIEDSRPDHVVFLVTRDSQPYAGRVRAALDPGVDVDEIRLETPDNVEHTFQRALDGLRLLREKGYAPEEIDADYTGGKKSMAAGLALAAAAFRCRTLKYVEVEWRDKRPVPGTEHFLTIPPAKILAHQDLQAALRLFGALQFEAVRQVLPHDEALVLAEYDRHVLADLRRLARAYDGWDKFQHGQVLKPYRQVEFWSREIEPFRLEPEIAERVQAMHDAAQSREPGEKLTADHLADLWNNARRRSREGKFDDAVARLYRLSEMLAQYALAPLGIDTGDLDVERLRGHLEAADLAKLEAQRDGDGLIQIGMREAYAVLDKLGAEVGAAFAQRPALGSLLGQRNASILAHGIEPISEKVARKLSEELKALIAVAVPDFERRCAELQFPWLKRD